MKSNRNKSIEIRRLILDSIKKYGRGHIGSAFSIVEILISVYSFFNISKKNINSEDRDRFILSKGHGCLALYAILCMKNFFSKKVLFSFCEPSSILGGHPEYGKIPGIEASTGSLGHGLPIATGMALSLKRKNNKTSKVIVLLGDGEMGEGSNWEAFLISAKYQLNNLIIIIDYNKLQSYSSIKDVQPLEPLTKKLKSFELNVKEVDGHDLEALNNIFNEISKDKKNNLPTVLIANTIKGKGLKNSENNLEWHHKSGLDEEKIEKLKNEIYF